LELGDEVDRWTIAVDGSDLTVKHWTVPVRKPARLLVFRRSSRTTE
jgi:hypothetical protein